MTQAWARTWRGRLTPEKLARLALGLFVGAVGGFVALSQQLPGKPRKLRDVRFAQRALRLTDHVTFALARQVELADVDRDGDPDLVYSVWDSVKWVSNRLDEPTNEAPFVIILLVVYERNISYYGSCRNLLVQWSW